MKICCIFWPVFGWHAPQPLVKMVNLKVQNFRYLTTVLRSDWWVTTIWSKFNYFLCKITTKIWVWVSSNFGYFSICMSHVHSQIVPIQCHLVYTIEAWNRVGVMTKICTPENTFILRHSKFATNAEALSTLL